MYRATTLAVHRERPDVHRLEGLPADASYYSGHTAAAIAVYGGIALLADLADPKPRSRRSRSGRPRSRSRSSSRSRACTAACTIRSTSPAASSSASPSWPRWCSSAAPPVTRPPRGRRVDEGAEGRGRRACGQDVRRRPRRAAARPRGGGHRRSALGGGAEEPQGSEAGQACAEGRRGAALRLGRRRHRAAVPRHGRGDEGARRDRAGRDGEPVRDEPRHPAGHPAGRRDRPARRAAPPRRGPLQRRALRRHGRRRLRRGDDPRRRRRAQGSPRPGRLRLDRVEEPAREAVQGEDLGGRRELVRRQGELHPRRQRRTAVRAASRPSRTRAPRTASSSSGW